MPFDVGIAFSRKQKLKEENFFFSNKKKKNFNTLRYNSYLKRNEISFFTFSYLLGKAKGTLNQKKIFTTKIFGFFLIFA
jgi:hypothetical protein